MIIYIILQLVVCALIQVKKLHAEEKQYIYTQNIHLLHKIRYYICMTSSGGYVDISTLLPYLITVVLIGLGLVNFVKFAAAKYLNPNIRFEGEENIAEISLRERKKGMEEKRLEVCAVCERESTKRCSRCKSVRYCSSECQSKHWNQGHKLDCRTATGHAVDTLKNSCNFSNAFRTSGKNATLSKSSNLGVSLADANGCSDKIMLKPKKVLFPYEKFVKLFYWNETNFPPCGLINCGNSCFANVVLQCLTYTRPLVAYLLEGIHTQTCRRNESCFLCELRRHVLRVSQSDEPFQPISILSHIAKMPGDLSCGRQEDAHEFMSVVVDSMQSILLDEFGGEKALHPDSRETTLIYHIFGGCLRSRVKCTQCFKISDNYDKSLDLIIEIHGDVSSLEDALEKHTSIEWLDGDNKYNCEGCQSYVRAQKQLTIHQAPNILTITLKRYQTGRFGKLNKRVTFPETVDISPYLSEKDDNLHIYKLYAVIVHVDMLNASFFGHYICYVKDLSGTWYRVDDCKVKSVELEEVLSQRGYMLLYSRISALPSPVADIPKSTATNMEKGHLNTSSASVQSHWDFMSKSDAYISSPFEVVTPLRSNLGSMQEVRNENVHVFDGLTTSNVVASIQRSDSAKGSYNSFDTDLSVDFTSEDSCLPTSNCSFSEGSSMIAGNETFDKMLSPLPREKLIDTCLHRTSCPRTLDSKNSEKCSASSVEGNAKQFESTNLQNERSISVCTQAGLTSLLQQNIDDDTPRTSDLTEDETSRISVLHSTDVYVEGPERMDCGNEVEQSFGNSSDSFNALLTESAIEEIVDCSLQQFPLNNSKTLVMDDKGIALPSSSFLCCPPTVISPDKYTSLDYKDSCRLPVGRSNVSDSGWMESDKDICHEVFIEQKVRNVSMPDVINTGIQSTEQEANLPSKDQETVPAILSHIHSSSAMDVGSKKLVGWTDRFHEENDMAEGSADSTSELESHEYNHTMVGNEKRQTGQIAILDNNSHGAMLPGSDSFPQVSPIEVACTEVKASSSNGAPCSKPVKKTIKTKPLFAAGFLNKLPNLHPLNFSSPSQENGNHSVSFSGSCSSREGSNRCLDSRSPLNVSSDEKCSIPFDEAKIANPTSSHFDIISKTSGTERVNDTKRKPLLAPGFLNRTFKSPAVTQSNASQMGCSTGDVAAVHKMTMVDGATGIEQFDTSNCKLMSANSELVDMTAEQSENVDHNQLENSTSPQKELITANGKKRTLSSESLHTDQENLPIVITKEMSNGGRQKQGRNDSCSCGSQRKWKKCCGSADALRQIAGR